MAVGNIRSRSSRRAGTAATASHAITSGTASGSRPRRALRAAANASLRKKTQQIARRFLTAPFPSLYWHIQSGVVELSKEMFVTAAHATNRTKGGLAREQQAVRHVGNLSTHRRPRRMNTPSAIARLGFVAEIDSALAASVRRGARRHGSPRFAPASSVHIACELLGRMFAISRCCSMISIEGTARADRCTDRPHRACRVSRSSPPHGDRIRGDTVSVRSSMQYCGCQRISDRIRVALAAPVRAGGPRGPLDRRDRVAASTSLVRMTRSRRRFVQVSSAVSTCHSSYRERRPFANDWAQQIDVLVHVPTLHRVGRLKDRVGVLSVPGPTGIACERGILVI